MKRNTKPWALPKSTRGFNLWQGLPTGPGVYGGLSLKVLFSALFVLIAASAAFGAIPVMDKPESWVLWLEKNTMDEIVVSAKFPVSPAIRDFERQAASEDGAPNMVVEYDMRVDGGKWFMNRKPGERRTESLQAHYLNTLRNGFLAYDCGKAIRDGAAYIDCSFEGFMFGLDEWDLKNHVYSFRHRFVYEQLLPGPGGPSYKERVTPWSDESKIGKGFISPAQ